MIFLTRRERFNAAHRLFRPELTDSENFRIFGACSNPNWHGHNYELYVTVKGEPDRMTGYLINLKEMSEIIRKRVIEKLDHKNINLEVDFMKDLIASTENLAVAIWKELEPPLKKHNAVLHCIRICESENNYVEYYG